MRWLTRSIRPNDNDPADVPPATVGPPSATPGDPHGVVVAATDPQFTGPPTTIRPSAWSGWPAEPWQEPLWRGQQLASLTDTAWACIDLNASVLASMPPYLVNAAPTLDAEWLRNPQPATYTSWAEFCKQLFWDYQAAGEVFVLATARYSTGYPARFHIVPGYLVDVEIGAGVRSYAIGKSDVSEDMLHIRYQSSVDDAHGHGPLEVGGARMTAASVLSRYALSVASGIPPSVLKHQDNLTAEQVAKLKAQWVEARASAIGEPAVLEGGITWEPTNINPKDMALVELAHFNESRIATLLGVPPFLVGLPSGGDSMTYSNVTSLFDYHYRSSLRPKSSAVMAALSEWLLPRGTTVEVNKDAYVQPGPLERAQTAEILIRTGVMTAEEVREVERLDNTTAEPLVSAPVVQ